MHHYFFKSKSCWRIQLHHGGKQIFQVITESSYFFELIPEEWSSISGDVFVKWFIDFSLLKWDSLGSHYEQNNSSWKKICLSSIISSGSVLLWWHIALGAFVRIELSISVMTLDSYGETKVSNFDIEIFVQKDVIKFEISMADPDVIVKVWQGTQNLLKEVSASWFTEFASHLDKVKNFSVFNEFKKVKSYCFWAIIVFKIKGSFTESIIFHNVGMIEFLTVDGLSDGKLRNLFVVIYFHNLGGHKLAIGFISYEEYLSGRTWTEVFVNFELFS